jgi:GDP-4-dehydro-6-deoxy-D-mannose reductase
MRAFVTGATGFVGPYLIRELLSMDYEVSALVRIRSNCHSNNGLDINYCIGDITDWRSIGEAISKCRPDIIFHLAGQSDVAWSWHEPFATMQTNVIGTMNALEAAKQYSPDTVIQVCGSSEEYGFVKPEEVPITEDQPLRPMSPYGVSKVGADLAGYQYAQSFGLKVVRTRAFNHSGIGRGPNFVTTRIARQTAEIIKGKREHYVLGNLTAIRDFTDVRDTVRAYRMLAEEMKNGKIEPGSVFNICSGIGRSVLDIVRIAAKRFSKIPDVQVDEALKRPSDVPLLIGGNDALKEATGWFPMHSIVKTINGMVDWQLSLMESGE